MFRMIRNSVIYETELLSKAFATLSSHLPPGWVLRELSRDASIEFDAAYALDDPQGVSAIIIAEMKVGSLEARQVSFLSEIWERRLMPKCQERFGDESNLALMVVVPSWAVPQGNDYPKPASAMLMQPETSGLSSRNQLFSSKRKVRNGILGARTCRCVH